ncbi:MAG: methionyl-tRNA formyltransferase [Chloroflexi bacterium]|nr:methionyl-tRNA formyltransferase [Chloroflexota bacterium]
MIRTLFMGTPAFAVPSLQALLGDDTYEIVGVVTQPDRKAGRGRKLQISPVKEAAIAADIPVLQPQKLREPAAFAELESLTPDLTVVAAYGQILRANVLELGCYGSINVHASLLPRWRGASPINAALLAGDRVTGSTIMRMDKGMDTGPILAQAAEMIQAEDTAGRLGERLAQQGAQLLVNTLPCYLSGSLLPRPQTDKAATICRLLNKEQARIDWEQAANHIERMVRAYDPWPGAFTTWSGANLKLGATRVVEGKGTPGEVASWDDVVAVGTGRGMLVVDQLQPAGKRMMSTRDFLRGRSDFVGALLGH